MNAYKDDPEVKKYIDTRLQEVNEQVYPILHGEDCTVDEIRRAIKREKFLRTEIKNKDVNFYLSTFDL